MSIGIPNVPYAEPPDKQFMTKPRWWRSERAHEGLLPSRVPRSACPSMEPGPRFAPRLRHADYSALLGVVSLLVCSPACLPAVRKDFCALFTRPEGLTLPGTGPPFSFYRSSGRLPRKTGRWRFRRERFLLEWLIRVPVTCRGGLTLLMAVDCLNTRIQAPVL